jgi:type II secretory pathway pseudopilin PulG
MSLQRRFTLVEMLVVIVIIVALLAMLLTGMSVARNKARNVKARAQITLLQTALTTYHTTYLCWPFHLTNATDDVLVTDSGMYYSSTTTPYNASFTFTGLLSCLYGTDAASNPRKIPFINAGEADLDPWGKTYRVALDMDADSKVNDAHIFGRGDLSVDVAVWSRGKDKADSSTDTAAVNNDNVTSWK